jgi:hypothetical protein
MPSRIFETVTLKPPADWVDASVISFVAPKIENFQANMVVTQHHIGDLSLTQYAQRQSDDFSNEVLDYDLLQGREHQIDGQNAYTLEHSFSADDPVRVQQLILFIQKDGAVYSVACTHAANEFEGMRNVFEETVRSFRIKEKA